MTIIHVLDHQSDTILGTSSLFYNDTHKETLKNEETFDFVEPVTSKAAPHLNKRNRIIIPVDDGLLREFIIEKSIQVKNGIEVYSVGSQFELMKAKPVDPITLQSQTVDMITDFVLNNSGWQRGITDYKGTRTLIFDDFTDPYNALIMIANEFGLELRFRVETYNNRIRGRYVDLIEHIGQWRGKEITSGKDLLNAKRTDFTQSVVTALVGIGPENEDGNKEVVTVSNESARQAWGRNGQHLWGIYKPPSDPGNQDMTRERLTELTSQELQKRISSVISYEVEGADIEHIFGREHEKVRLGDMVRIKATEFNPPFFLDARIVSREGSIREKSKKKYVLGEFIEYSADDIRSVKRMLEKQIAKKLSETQVLEITYPKGDIDEKLKDVPITDNNFPDETPPTPTNFDLSGLFKIIQLKWDYNTSSLISAYEVYASQTDGFTPDESNLVWRGKAGGYNFEAQINQTWYFRIRTINYKGTASEYSEQIMGQTVQIKAEDILPRVITNELIAESAAIDFAKIANVQITDADIYGTLNVNRLSGNFLQVGKDSTNSKLNLYTSDNDYHYIESTREGSEDGSGNITGGLRIRVPNGPISLSSNPGSGIYITDSPLVLRQGMRVDGTTQFNSDVFITGAGDTLYANDIWKNGSAVLSAAEAMGWFADINHTHSEYASVNHSHSQYAEWYSTYNIRRGSATLKFLASGSPTIQARNYWDDAYGTFEGLAYSNVSRREEKKDIEIYEKSALDLIEDTPVYSYRYNSDLSMEPKRVGLIYDEAPMEIMQFTGGIDVYGMASLMWKAIQELNHEINLLKGAV
ncbi:phage tail spike protein [Cytobacillus firmus]|uniref:phage tail spike protein n=1 Tax=Cytobacillus firmus TaxID=1399 RepID=UPI0018CEA8D7|nr:phage tail spike protein [Cytobacillus firmus]MED1907877.1 phage tail spike protein [Cytobacillus firmus]